MLALTCYPVFAQQKAIDSFELEPNIIHSDAARVKKLLEVAEGQLGNEESTSALHTAKQALQLSTIRKLKKEIICSHLIIGNAFRHRKMDDSANVHLNKASALSDELGDSILQRKCLEYIARSFEFASNRYDSILHYNLLALSYAVKQKDSAALISNYYIIARTYDALGYESKAMENTLQALRLAEKKKDTAMIIRITIGKAIVLCTVERYAEAKIVMRSAIGMEKSNIDSLSSQFLHSRSVLGWIYEACEDYDSLFYNADIVLRCALKIKDAFYIAISYYQQAVFYNSKKSPDTALKFLRQSLNTYADIDFKANVYREMGRAYFIKNNFSMAAAFLNKSIENGNKVHARDELRDSYKLLWQVYKGWNMHKPALEAYEKYNHYKDSTDKMNNITAMNLLETQHEFDQKEQRINLLSSENELKTVLAQKENQRKNFALAGIAVIALIGGYGFYWFRRKKHLQSEQNLMNERLRISRELHDEVGATLSGVAMYSHLTKTQLQSKDLSGVENSLTIMQDSSAQMVNKLNDIVWLINPDKSSLPDLIQRLEEYARKMAAAKNMEISVNVYEAIHQQQLTMEQRRNIYLFCKEAINNAVKYSEGSLLELKVSQSNAYLEFSIQDNGKGFDPETVKHGNGLNNLQQRADEVGAEYSIRTSEGNGTLISLLLKIT